MRWAVTLGVDAVVQTVNVGTFLALDVSDSLTVSWTEANVFGAVGWISETILLTPGSHSRN